jgi:hypothetical protein
MVISPWLVQAFVAIGLTVIAFIILAGLIWAGAKALDLIAQAFRLYLGFLGMWASYFNYIQVVLRSVDGGASWANHMMEPSKSELEPTRNVDAAAYFKIHPHPEHWRWWMRLLGLKRPAAKDA